VCPATHLPADVDGPGAGTPPTGGSGPLAAAAQQPGSNLMQVEPVTQSEDTWVTVFGFSPDDLALVLQVSCSWPAICGSLQSFHVLAMVLTQLHP
jgi:hypothetical protein